MAAYPVPVNEFNRLAYLNAINIDFSAPIAELQQIARLASEIAETPIALISLVTADMQKFAANIGLPGVDETTREVAFCAHAIMGSEPFVVTDALQDDRFADNPLVTGSLGIRAYAGSVLEPQDGIRIGTLCVIDTKPRVFSAVVLSQLDALSDAVTALLLGHRDRLLLQEKLLLENQLRRDVIAGAERDPLTGLFNQAAFRNRVDQAIATANGTEALIVIDADHFKQVNDRYGHPYGDMYLRLIADGLAEGFGPGALVARIGGDEFAAFVQRDNAAAHLAAIEKTREIIRAAVARLDKPNLGSLSVGLCGLADIKSPNFTELYQRADVALYAAKDRGRNTTCVFANKLNDEYNLRTQRARFEDALVAGEVEPFFQPKVDLATGHTLGFELLARWRDPRRGLLTPAYFHRLLTDRQIAPRLTTLMISHAIATHRDWKSRTGVSPHFAVNVTHHDLGDPSFVEQTEWLLRGGGLDWRNLELEVTETAILNDTDDQVRKSMMQVRQNGGRISLDDFGTGHASLIHLRDWQIDVLKLDMSFVREVTTNPKDEAIVSAIINLAHRLGLSVVAEGIETQEVATKLQFMGCQIGQGFLFSPAVDAETAFARFFDMTAAQRIRA